MHCEMVHFGTQSILHMNYMYIIQCNNVITIYNVAMFSKKISKDFSMLTWNGQRSKRTRLKTKSVAQAAVHDDLDDGQLNSRTS